MLEAAPAVADDARGFSRREVCWPLAGGEAQARLLGGALRDLSLPTLGALGRALIRLGAPVGARPVFIDTETTGLAGGGALPFSIGVAWHDGASIRTRQWTLTRLGSEAAMLADLLASLRALDPAPLVSFNGASFDLPLLRLRALRHRLAAPELAAPHLDLLHCARRLWKGRAPDCKLATLERRVLGVARQGDIDSAAIPEVFWDSLRLRQEGRACPEMVAVAEHNLVDLLTLPALAERLAASLVAPVDLDQALRAARHLRRLGLEAQARALLADWLAPILDDRSPIPGRARSLLVEASLELATLDRRAGERERAGTLWRLAWSCDPRSPIAAEAWAKHLEHHVGDHAEALRVVRGSRLPCPRRIARLERRLQASESPSAGPVMVESPVAGPVAVEPAPVRTTVEPAPRPELPSPPSLPVWAPWRRPTPDPTRHPEPRAAAPSTWPRASAAGDGPAAEIPALRYRLYR